MPALSLLHRPTLMMIHPSHLITEKMVLLAGLSHPDHQLVSDPVVLRGVQCRPHHARFLLWLLENVYQHSV